MLLELSFGHVTHLMSHVEFWSQIDLSCSLFKAHDFTSGEAKIDAFLLRSQSLLMKCVSGGKSIETQLNDSVRIRLKHL